MEITQYDVPSCSVYSAQPKPVSAYAQHPGLVTLALQGDCQGLISVNTSEGSFLFRRAAGSVLDDVGTDFFISIEDAISASYNTEVAQRYSSSSWASVDPRGLPLAIVPTDSSSIQDCVTRSHTDKKYSIGSRAQQVQLQELGLLSELPASFIRTMESIKQEKYPDFTLQPFLNTYCQLNAANPEGTLVLVGKAPEGDVFTMLVTPCGDTLYSHTIICSEEPAIRKRYSPYTVGHYHTLQWATGKYAQVDFGLYFKQKAVLGFPATYFPQLRLNADITHRLLNQ